MYVYFDFKELSYIDYVIKQDVENITRRLNRFERLHDRESYIENERFLAMRARVALGDNIRERILNAVAYSEVIDYSV